MKDLLPSWKKESSLQFALATSHTDSLHWLTSAAAGLKELICVIVTHNNKGERKQSRDFSREREESRR